MKTIPFTIAVALCVCIDQTATASEDLTIWHRKPAAKWDEATPVGNGRLGAMVFGHAATERIQLNEDSLWSGAPQDADNPAALEALPEIRKLIFEGKYVDAQNMARKFLVCRGVGSNRGRGYRVPYGSYETLGDLNLVFQHEGEPEDYRRALDLDRAVATVSYRAGGVRYEREIFSSAPDQVLVVRLRADKPGALNFRASLTRPEAAETVADGASRLLMRGQLWNGESQNGMKFAARLAVHGASENVRADGGALVVTNATEVTLLLAAATDYRMQLPDWRHGDPEEKSLRHLEAALKKPVNAIRDAHIADYQKLFRRVSIDLGSSDAAKLPTDQRLDALKQGARDPGLAALYFQFGRYLLISSSRPGDMPANLQGLWADTVHPPWSADYHANINLQMIYWPAETANLAECFEPLDRYVHFLTGPGSKTAKVHYNARGWTVHTLANPWGFTAPGEKPEWGLSPSAGAWLAQHLWEHHAFSKDMAYLKRALPVLRASAEFGLDWLVEHPQTGKLVAGPATSPEHGFITPDGQKASLCMGPSMEQQIIYDSFHNYLEATRLLGIDEPTVAEVKQALPRMQGPQIGKDGRLMEWSNDDFADAEPGHRHVSHLFALHPGKQISRAQTPDLAAAARKALDTRLASGGGHTGWSRAWIICFFARLGDGAKAGENVHALLAKSALPNLFSTHPPFQIDGNFGGVAGICEMLVQSHAGEIELLPALPPDWRDGFVKGLRARGGYEVDITWRDGNLHSATVRNINGAQTCKIRHGGKLATADFTGRPSVTLDGSLGTE